MKYLQCKKKELTLHRNSEMVSIAQLVRASDCGSEGRGFETHISPKSKRDSSLKSPSCFFSFSNN